ncbi:uncharacterized protein [Rutidosis leptorrhynchoides]|uniref:uncharacterized protein n=1 Tax=Rutidosis leptorrhynchoides TaxID=125765 RepID=UPI003A9929F2
MEDLETTSNCLTTTTPFTFSDNIDSDVSTPYVSAPSSPGREPPRYGGGGGFFYSAPASPIHHMLSSISSSITNLETAGGSFEFELATGPEPSGSMSSADELFLNGQIRPMKLSSHLQCPQDLTPLTDISEIDGDEDTFSKSRDLKSRDRRRRARSMSPLRSNTTFQWLEEFKDGRECTELDEIKEKLEVEDKQRAIENDNETPSSGASSRSSSVGRSSKRWEFLKEFLYRSKSEGRNSTNSNKNNHKFWSTLSLKKSSDSLTSKAASASEEVGTATAEVTPRSSKSAANKSVRLSNSKTTGAAEEVPVTVKTSAKKSVNGVGVNRKRSGVRSAHEMLYTMNRAQAEEMMKKTYLPYRHGLFGCLGFNSKGYGAMHGFARALNPVSSR